MTRAVQQEFTSHVPKKSLFTQKMFPVGKLELSDWLLPPAAGVGAVPLLLTSCCSHVHQHSQNKLSSSNRTSAEKLQLKFNPEPSRTMTPKQRLDESVAKATAKNSPTTWSIIKIIGGNWELDQLNMVPVRRR